MRRRGPVFFKLTELEYTRFYVVEKEPDAAKCETRHCDDNRKGDQVGDIGDESGCYANQRIADMIQQQLGKRSGFGESQ